LGPYEPSGKSVSNAEHVERLRQIKLIDEVLDCTERVLNPAAHAGDPPLYEKEVQEALNLIRQLEGTLAPRDFDRMSIF
jgi:hypothetical protein